MPDIPEIPEDLTQLTRDQLTDLEGQLLARFEELRAAGGDTAEAVAELARIAETLPGVGDRIDALDQQARQAEESAAAVEAYQTRRRDSPPEQPADVDTGGTGGGGDTTGDNPAGDPPPADLAPPVDLAPGTEVVAAGRRTVASIAARAPHPVVPQQRPESHWYTSLTAGSDIPGMAVNAPFQSAQQVYEAIIARTESLVRADIDGQQAMVARAHLPQLGEPIGASESGQFGTMQLVKAVQRWQTVQQRRSLTADVGFCAPTETIWDLCEYGVADGLIDIPEVGITRGGLRFFKLPELACFDNYTWRFGPDPDELVCMDKPCLEIPCPTPEEALPAVIGACLKAGILQARQFPELVEVYVRNAMVRHQILISKATLAMIEAGSEPVVYSDSILGGSGFTAAILAAAEFQALDLRADYMLGMGDTLNVILPDWVRGAIRADLANRMGVDLLSVSDARIDELFADRNIRVQWIKNWQDECVGAPGAQRAYPTTVRMLIFRDGAWVRGLEPVIELDNLYDSELLRQNKLVRLFTEQALLMANLCTTSRVVTIPVCPNGSTHSGQPIVCFSEACTPGTVTCPPNVECPPLPCCEDDGDGTTPPAPAPTP